MPKPFKSRTIKVASKPGKKEKQPAEEKLTDFYQQTKFPIIQKPASHQTAWGLVILVSVLFAFATGFVYQLLFAQQVIIDGDQKTIINKKENVTVTSQERLKEIAENINPVIVNFYTMPNGTSGPFYQDAYSLGSGFVLTSDGWIMTTQKVMDRIKDKDYLILTANYQV